MRLSDQQALSLLKSIKQEAGGRLDVKIPTPMLDDLKAWAERKVDAQTGQLAGMIVDVGVSGHFNPYMTPGSTPREPDEIAELAVQVEDFGHVHKVMGESPFVAVTPIDSEQYEAIRRAPPERQRIEHWEPPHRRERHG